MFKKNVTLWYTLFLEICLQFVHLVFFFFNTQIRVSLQFAIFFIAFIAQSVNKML